MIARQVGANAHPRREAATRCEWMAPLLARYLVPYLVPSDGAPAHDRRWLYSKICARCVGRGVVCWQLMAAMAMGRFRFTRRGGGLPRRATDSGASRRAAAGRRRARGCARCGLRLGYQLYRIIAVPITYWYLLLRSRCTGAGSLLARSGPGLCSFRSFSAGVRGGYLSCARRVPLLCGPGYAATTCVAVLPSCAVEIPAVLYRMFGRGVLWCGVVGKPR